MSILSRRRQLGLLTRVGIISFRVKIYITYDVQVQVWLGQVVSASVVRKRRSYAWLVHIWLVHRTFVQVRLVQVHMGLLQVWIVQV